MDIRRANTNDMPAIGRLLSQVLTVHHEGRPDIFRAGARKYTDEQLAEIIRDEARPIFVATDPDDKVLGYAFCLLRETRNDNILQDQSELYIDDLCVDEAARHMSVGRRLCEYCLDYAAKAGCDRVTLNVWECNPGARAFYETMGFAPYRTSMEKRVTEVSMGT